MPPLPRFRRRFVGRLRRGGPSVALIAVCALVAVGCTSEDEPPTIGASTAPTAAGPTTTGPTAAGPSSSEPTPSASTSSAPTDQQNQALLDAGATALGEVADSTVVSIDSERRDTVWEVELVDQQGQEHTVGVSIDGQQVTTGPSDSRDDAEDRAENRRKVAAAGIDYEEAVAAIDSARAGRIVELNLDHDDDDGTVVWESDVRSDGTKYEVHVNAKSGKVVRNRADRDD